MKQRIEFKKGNFFILKSYECNIWEWRRTLKIEYDHISNENKWRSIWRKEKAETSERK